jgi:fructosamine-3-kinase
LTLPSRIRHDVDAALAAHGARPVAKVASLSGGCISAAARIEDAAGTPFFLKWGESDETPDLFVEEARSLRALERTGAVRVPGVIAESAAFLLLEWLEPGSARPDAWARAGRALAHLHRTHTAEFGWEHDNYIGSLPQSNAWQRDWPAFWRDARILPQLERAYAAGHFAADERKRIDGHLDGLPSLLAAGQTDGPALLHGDLWRGNVHAMANGDLALIDPSSSWGHREVDLAMAHLFGGFDPAFFAAYEQASPLADGSARRRAAYQVYYLLVHVNLFGSGYCRSVVTAVEKAG